MNSNCVREKELEEMTKEELVDMLKASRQCADVMQNDIYEKNEFIKSLSEDNYKLKKDVNNLVETIRIISIIKIDQERY